MFSIGHHACQLDSLITHILPSLLTKEFPIRWTYLWTKNDPFIKHYIPAIHSSALTLLNDTLCSYFGSITLYIDYHGKRHGERSAS